MGIESSVLAREKIIAVVADFAFTASSAGTIARSSGRNPAVSRQHGPGVPGGPEVFARVKTKATGVTDRSSLAPFILGAMRLGLNRGRSDVGVRSPAGELEHRMHPRQKARRVEPRLHCNREPAREQGRRARAEAMHQVHWARLDSAGPPARPGEALGQEGQVGEEPPAQRPG